MKSIEERIVGAVAGVAGQLSLEEALRLMAQKTAGAVTDCDIAAFAEEARRGMVPACARAFLETS